MHINFIQKRNNSTEPFRFIIMNFYSQRYKSTKLYGTETTHKKKSQKSAYFLSQKVEDKKQAKKKEILHQQQGFR